MPMNNRLLRPIASRATLPSYSPAWYSRVWCVTEKPAGTVQVSANSWTDCFAVKWWDGTVSLSYNGSPASKAAAGGRKVFEVYPAIAPNNLSPSPTGALINFDISGNALTEVRADNIALTAVYGSLFGYSTPTYANYILNAYWPSHFNGTANLSGNSLSSIALNQFYSDISSGSGFLYVDGNPGIDADDPTIATAKGYTVFGSVPPTTSLLLNFNGTNGSTTFTDSSPNGLAVTANGNAQISTAQSKFGGASGLFDGAGDYLSVPASPAFGFGTGDFTIECWAYPLDMTRGVIVDTRPSDVPMPLVLSRSEVGPGKLRWYDGATVREQGVFPENAWTHIAWSRSRGVGRLFINGVLLSALPDTADYGSSRGLTVGANASPQYENFHGHIDDLRIVKGVGLYTSNFTPPTSPLGVHP